MVRLSVPVAFLLGCSGVLQAAPTTHPTASELQNLTTKATSLSATEVSEHHEFNASPGPKVPLGEEPALPVTVTSMSKRGDAPISGYRRINVINSTPYRWKRISIKDHKIKDWNDIWPEYIESGESLSPTSKRRGTGKRKYTGEVTYKLEGTCKPMSFKILYNPEKKTQPEVRVQFQGELRTKYIGEGAELNLGDRVGRGGVNFVLAGTEQDGFISRDDASPVGWMQELIDDIGDFPLNEIVMVRSHHAGMNKGRKGVGFVYDKTTLTQTRTPYEQMKIAGARVLDFRPYERTGRTFSEGHFSKIAGLHHGMIGISLESIIDNINQFLDENPGEMVILDIHDTESWTGWFFLPDNDYKFRALEEESRNRLYKALEKLKHRVDLAPAAEDVHRMTLNSFVGGKKSAVLIHAPEPWLKDNAFPGSEGGFVTNRNFPRTAYWSDTEEGIKLLAEQATTLAQRKPHRGGRVYDSQWVLRLPTALYIIPKLSLTDLAKDAWGRLYDGMWSAVDEDTYPNWMTFDALETQEAKELAMVMNRCLVARKCGQLGGKVPGAERLELPKCKALD